MKPVSAWLLAAFLCGASAAAYGAPGLDARRSALLTAVDNWKLLLPAESADPVAAKHRPKLDDIRGKTADPRSGEETTSLEKSFETWKADFLNEMFQRDHTLYFSDPKRFEVSIKERLDALTAIRDREKRPVNPAQLSIFQTLKQELGGFPDWGTLNRIFDKLGKRRNLDALLNAKTAPEEASKPAEVVFTGWRRLSPDNIEPPPFPTLAGQPNYQSVKDYILRTYNAKPEIVDLAIQEARSQGVDPLLVLAVITCESRFNPTAKSKADARGLMQLMPQYLRKWGAATVDALWHPLTNVRAGTRFLKELWGEFCDFSMAEIASLDPAKRRRVEMAIAAYNAGDGAVKRANGVPHNSETPGYVVSVLKAYNTYRRVGAA